MDDKLRQGSGSTTATTTGTTTGTGTVESAQPSCCCCDHGPAVETIQVEQVLGAEMTQRVLEISMVVPEQKPDIEQVLDVFVKDVEITSITVITDKVIVRGTLGIKVLYVADLPAQPVHAFEKEDIRFTRDIVIPGAAKEMKATAQVTVEFVDYDFDEDDPRQVQITIVLKIWARVVSTVEMEVTTLGVVDEIGEVESTTAAGSTGATLAASAVGTDTSAAHYAGYGAENVLVTGMVPTVGTIPTGPSTAVVTGSVVNVRSGPGTNFPIVTKVNKGTTVTIKEQAFGWYRVVLPDGTTTGWVAGWLVAVTTPSQTMG